jgi:hypothetical protein
MAAAKQEAAAAKEAAAAFEQKMSEKDTEINNLDASIKEQKAELDALREQMKAQALPKGWKAAFRAELEKQRPAIEAALSGKADRYKVEIELKTIYDVGTGVISGNAVAGVDLNPEVVAAAPVGNAFIAVLGIRPRRGNKIAWIEGTPHSGADYVAELASAAGTQSDVTFTEVTRAFNHARAPEIIDVHHLRVVSYGSLVHVDAHMVVPDETTMIRVDEIRGAIEAECRRALGPGADVTIQAESCDGAACRHCRREGCSHRDGEFRTNVVLNLDTVVMEKSPAQKGRTGRKEKHSTIRKEKK